MTCSACTDPDGESCYPIYGLAPHVHVWHGVMIIDTITSPVEDWPAHFQEDPESLGMGLWWCPLCGHGKPDFKKQL
jgi:hypothetical protein